MQNPTPMSSHSIMHPCQLDFTNPQACSPFSTLQSSRTLSMTPMNLTPTFSDTNTSHQSESSSLTLSLGSIKLGQEHDHPHKQVAPPSYDDILHGASEEEKQRWYKCKRTEMWRFPKLMSQEGSKYRKSEKERSLQYYYDKKLKSGSEGFEDIDNIR